MRLNEVSRRPGNRKVIPFCPTCRLWGVGACKLHQGKATMSKAKRTRRRRQNGDLSVLRRATRVAFERFPGGLAGLTVDECVAIVARNPPRVGSARR